MIEIRTIDKSYTQPDKSVRIFSDLSLKVAQGEMVALMGASGEGKTTLMHILGCLDRPDAGEYWLRGTEVSRLPEEALAAVRNRDVGFVFQSSFFVDYLNLVENVALPGLYKKGDHAARDTSHANRLLKEVGLGHRLDHLPAELSGGERQRAAIARALFNNPHLLLADEPTGNLDDENTRNIMQQLLDLNQSGLTVVLVTHDEKVARYASRVLSLEQGTLQEIALD